MVGLLSRVAIAVVSAILLIAPCGVAQAERRVALVVGNSDYTVARISLPNPKNDAQDIAAVLKELDFEVIAAVNASKRDMDLKLAEFARKSTDADAVLFYYAGHAMQLQGRNFLMPVDAELEDEFSVQYQMVGLDYVRAALDRVNGVKIMILDACRNNPLANRVQRSAGLTRSVAETTRGLARIDKTQGMVIAYATAVDDVAEDGNGRNSPFTTALLRRLREPGLEIATMFRRVASDVNAQTGGRQRPELTINLLDDYVLNQTDSIAWGQTNQDDAEALRNFITRYPASPHAVFARNRLDLMERYAKEREEQRKAAEDAQRRVAEEAQRKAAEETRRKAAEEAQRKTAEEAQRKAIEEARRKAAAEEAQRKAAEEAQRKVTEEAQRKAAEEAQRKAAEEAQRKLADEAQRKGAEEVQRKVAEAQRKTAEEAQRKAAEESQRLATQREAEERQRAEQQAALERKRVEEERQRADLFKLQAAEQKRQEEQRVAALQQQAEQQRIDAQKRLDAQEDAARKRIQETCDHEQAKLDQFKNSQAGGADVRTDLKKFEIEASCNSLRPLIADMIASLATVSPQPTGPANPPAMPAVPAPAAQAANTADQILKAQQELKRLGCFLSKPDGKLSRATEAAVKSYWTHIGQTATEVKITDEFLSDIEQHDKPVCEQPVIASRPPPARPREDVARPPQHVQKAAPAETPRAPVALARPAPPAPAPAAPRPAIPTAHAITGIGM